MRGIESKVVYPAPIRSNSHEGLRPIPEVRRFILSGAPLPPGGGVGLF